MQLAPHLHQLTIPFFVPLPQGRLERFVNLWILFGETVTLIDSGVAGAEEAIAATLAENGQSLAQLDTLLLTHSHPDHIGSARSIVAASSCRVFAHAAERLWIEDVALQQRERPVPGFATLVAGGAAVAAELRDGQPLDAPGGVLTVMHTPGHSPGSLSFWQESHGVLICGDSVPLPGELPIIDDPAAALCSLQRLQQCGAAQLLSSWDVPRCGGEVASTLARGVAWLEEIKAAVTAAGADSEDDGGMALCREVTVRLGLPAAAVNPLVARTFVAFRRQADGIVDRSWSN